MHRMRPSACVMVDLLVRLDLDTFYHLIGETKEEPSIRFDTGVDIGHTWLRRHVLFHVFGFTYSCCI